MISPELPRRRASALVTEGGGGRHLGLLEQVIGERQGSAKVLTAGSGTVLRERRSGFEDQVRVRNQAP